MGLHELVRNSYFPKVVGLASLLLVLWWGGLLSPSSSRIEKTWQSEARILEVNEKAWLVQLPDGRKARVYASRARDHRPGDTVRLQLVRYENGDEEAMVLGR